MPPKKTGEGGTGSPKAPGTFLPSQNQPPAESVEKKVVGPEIKSSPKRLISVKVLKSLGLDPNDPRATTVDGVQEILRDVAAREEMEKSLAILEEQRRLKGEFGEYKIGEILKIKNADDTITYAEVESFDNGAMTVKWETPDGEKIKTLNKRSEIYDGPSIIKQTSTPQQSTIESKESVSASVEYQPGQILKIKNADGSYREVEFISPENGKKIKVKPVGSSIIMKVNKSEVLESSSDQNEEGSQPVEIKPNIENTEIISREYKVGEKLRLKRKIGRPIEAEVVEIKDANWIVINQKGKHGKIFPRTMAKSQIDEDYLPPDENNPEEKTQEPSSQIEQTSSRRPEDTFFRLIYRKTKSKNESPYWIQLSEDKEPRQIKVNSEMKPEERIEIEGLLRRSRIVIKKNAGQVPDLVKIKDELLNLLKSGNFVLARNKKAELEKELNNPTIIPRDPTITPLQPVSSTAVVTPTSPVATTQTPPQISNIPTQTNNTPQSSTDSSTSKTFRINTPQQDIDKMMFNARDMRILDKLKYQGGVWYQKDNGGYKKIERKDIKGDFLTLEEWISITDLLKKYKDFMSTEDRVHAFSYSLKIKRELIGNLENLDFASARKTAKELENEFDVSKEGSMAKINAETQRYNLEKLARGASPLELETWQSEFIKDPYGSQQGVPPKIINPITGEWILMGDNELKLFEYSRDVLHSFHSRMVTQPGMVEKKNEILNYLNKYDFENAKKSAEEYLATYSSSSSRGSSRSSTGRGGVPPSTPGGTTGGRANIPPNPPIPPVPPIGAPASPTSAPKPLDVLSTWPSYIYFDTAKGRKCWVFALDPKNKIDLPNDEWGREFTNATPVFASYINFINGGDSKEKDQKKFACRDLIDLKNEIIEALKRRDVGTAGILRENLKNLTDQWVARWPKVMELIKYKEEFGKQNKKFDEQKEWISKNNILITGKLERIKKLRIETSVDKYRKMIEANLGRGASVETSLRDAYKELLDEHTSLSETLRKKQLDTYGYRGSVLHPIIGKPRSIMLTNGEPVSIAEYNRREKTKKEEVDSAEKIKREKDLAALKKIHMTRYFRDPDEYRKVYVNKKFLQGDPNEAIVKELLETYEENIPSDEKMKEYNKAFEERERFERETRQTAGDLHYSPIAAEGLKNDEKLRSAAIEAKETELGKPITAEEYKNPDTAPKYTPVGDGLVPPINNEPYSGGTMNPERDRRVRERRNKSVGSLLGILDKMRGGNWIKYVGPIVLGASITTGVVMLSKNDKTEKIPDTPVASAPSKATTPAPPSITTAPTIQQEEAGWMRWLQSDEDKNFARTFVDNKISDAELIAKYMPSVPSSSLNADSWQVFNDTSGKIIEGTIDQNGVNHRNDMSKFISNLLKVRQAIVAENKGEQSETYPTPQVSIRDFLAMTRADVRNATKI